MSVAYVDSSCVVAIALEEPVAARVERLLARFSRRVSSNLLEAEVRAALAREKAPASAALFATLAWVLPNRALTAELERVAAGGSLRGADCWHVACALHLNPSANELAFVTLDLAQRRVASAIGFSTPAP